MLLPAFLLGFVLVVMLGVLTGIVTGLSPGLHVNNVAAFVLATEPAWAAFLASILPEATAASGVGIFLALYLLATAAAHAVFDFIPSVFLGAPNEDTALAALPGHRLLRVGQGAKAVALAARGVVLGTAFAVLALIPLRAVLSDPIGLADHFRPWSAVFLAFVLGALLVSESRGGKARRVWRAAWVQALAAALGVATLRGPTPLDAGVILFPLFSGLFGIPSLLIGLRAGLGTIPPQRLEPLRAINRTDVRSSIRGTLAGASVSWLPGLSGGAAATLASLRVRKSTGPSQFMVVLGAVSSSTALLSVAVLYMIHRSRSGAAVAVDRLLPEVGSWTEPLRVPASLAVLIIGTVLATAVAAPLAVRTARWVASRSSTADPRRVCGASLVALVALLAVVSGPVGLAIASLAAVVGLVPIALRVRRVHLMASLLVPVLIGYLAAV